MTFDIILLDETQCAWVNSENETNVFKAPICDYIDVNSDEYNNCIDATILTLTGYEAWATYFVGATVTEIEVAER